MKTHFYIDVDGVLANFIKALEFIYDPHLEKRLAQYAMANARFKEPFPSLKSLLGFDSFAAMMTDIDRQSATFWEDIPRFDHAISLIQYLDEHERNKGSSWSFLTTPSLYTKNFEQQRDLWLARLIRDALIIPARMEGIEPLRTTFRVRYSNQKEEVIAETLALGLRPVLIDDHIENVQAFCRNGGLGLLFPAATNQLAHIRDNPLIPLKLVLNEL